LESHEGRKERKKKKTIINQHDPMRGRMRHLWRIDDDDDDDDDNGLNLFDFGEEIRL
jgi:hypothetical protein